MKKRNNRVISFINDNKLFIVFFLLSLLIGFLLRGFTVGWRFRYKAVLSDSLFVILISSFGYLMKPKTRYKYYFGWLFFFAALAIANTIYYNFYKSFINIELISTASMISKVNDAFFAKLHPLQFLYLLVPAFFVFIHRKLLKSGYYTKLEEIENDKTYRNISVISAVISFSILLIFSIFDNSQFTKPWYRGHVVQKYGLYLYTFNDIVQSIHSNSDDSFGYDEAALAFREYYACKWEEKSKPNKYTDIFKGKNVIFIHAESIQNFLVDLKINGEEVTPNLNKLSKEGIYFDRFYPQISVGTSSDTEFTLMTGLLPSSRGTVFVNFYDRKYPTMVKYFNDMGYYTFSTHANDAEYWNRKTMYNTIGYQDFFAKESYEVPFDIDDPSIVGLGLGDKEFFKQFINKLKVIEKNNKPFFGTVITLSNHSPFNDVDKYSPFNVTMDYITRDKRGNKIVNSANYLEGTMMGNYLKSSHYADEALGEFIDSLKENNLLENTVIIFYGDHEARISPNEFEKLYNYVPETDGLLSSDDENYVSMSNYNYDLLKNTPLIIWSNDEEYNLKISSTMGMYDVLPTISNMFGFKEKYSLGHDIFSDNEKIVVFPNGNVLTDKVYYSSLNEDYITFVDEPIDSDYIERISKYSDNILEVSNGIVFHNLIETESNKINKCNKPK